MSTYGLTRHQVSSDSGCWLWLGSLSRDGYAACKEPESNRAHRVYYIRMVGPIPTGKELDHLCVVRHCVNPAHLEAVTHLENHRRSRVGILTEADVIDIRRSNETTESLAERYGVAYITLYQARVGTSWRAVPIAPTPFPKRVRDRSPACSRGHEFTPENTRIEAKGKRKCRTCCADRARAYRAAASKSRRA